MCENFNRRKSMYSHECDNILYGEGITLFREKYNSQYKSVKDPLTCFYRSATPI